MARTAMMILSLIEEMFTVVGAAQVRAFYEEHGTWYRLAKYVKKNRTEAFSPAVQLYCMPEHRRYVESARKRLGLQRDAQVASIESGCLAWLSLCESIMWEKDVALSHLQPKAMRSISEVHDLSTPAATQIDISHQAPRLQ